MINRIRDAGYVLILKREGKIYFLINENQPVFNKDIKKAHVFQTEEQLRQASKKFSPTVKNLSYAEIR